MFFLRSFAILVFSVLISCGNTMIQKSESKSKRPVWIDNPGRSFSQSNFMTGVGSGDSRRDAENDALAALAKIFSVEIKVNQKVLENYLEQEVDGKTKSAFSSMLLGKTSAKAVQELKNIRIAHTHFAEAEAVYYALAVLDRAETAAIYQTEIERNREKIKAYHQHFTTSTQKLHQLKYINKTLDLTRINNGLSDQLRIISGRDLGAQPISESALKAQKLELLERISFSARSAGKTYPEIQTYIIESVAKTGFKQVDQGGDFSFSYQFSANKTNINRDNIVALQWHLEIFMRDNVNQTNLKTFTKDKRSSGISDQAARAKMLRAVKKTINEDFYSDLLSYLNGL